jgi:hypothetical protein
MNLTPDESVEKEQVTLDFFEGYIVQAIEGLRKEKDPTKNAIFVDKMRQGLEEIFNYRGEQALNDVIKKYNLDKEFGVRTTL